MRNTILVPALLFLGCAAQVVTPGRALVLGRDKAAVFVAALQSAQDAGLVVKSADQNTGYIYATMSLNPITHSSRASLSLSITVAEEAGGVAVNIKAILGQQLLAGDKETTKTVRAFCKAFLARVPEAQVTVDGLPDKP